MKKKNEQTNEQYAVPTKALFHFSRSDWIGIKSEHTHTPPALRLHDHRPDNLRSNIYMYQWTENNTNNIQIIYCMIYICVEAPNKKKIETKNNWEGNNREMTWMREQEKQKKKCS